MTEHTTITTSEREDEDVQGFIVPIIYGLAFGYGMMAGAGITTAILNHTTGTLNGPLQRH